jgi:hypothetical protein
MDMNRRILFTFAVLATSSLFASAADPDRRFEGIWKGVETLTVDQTIFQPGQPPQSKLTVIAIGEAGKTLAIVEGLYPGRYMVALNSPHGNIEGSGGNALVYSMGKRPSAGYYRDVCKLVISQDGSTFTETGHALLPGVGGDLHGTPVGFLCRISGTFHRQSKK